MNLASLAERNLEDYGEYERLVFEGQSYTNRQLHDASRHLAAALIGLGLGPNDKIVVMLPNGPEVLVTYAAAWRAGLVVIPVLFLLEADELAFILQNSRAKAIVTSPEYHEKATDAVRSSQSSATLIVTGPESAVLAPAVSFERLEQSHATHETIVPREKNDLATILYTSGTTGKPKGVMQTHHNLYSNAMNSWNTATNRTRRETTLLVLPLAHTFGLSALIGGYLLGGRSILMKWFNAEDALELIQRYKVAAMAGVPTMFVFMLFHPRRSDFDTSSVRRWLVGAAPMPVHQQKEFEVAFGGTMYVGYGLTEACPGVAVEREGFPQKPGSTGMPMVGVEVKIVDDEGRTVETGQIGEICACGENVSPGYYENPEATAETFRDGWLHTGDMGHLDSDNYLFVSERKKDLVIRAGFNVYPKDVEDVLYRHPAVQEAAVVGIPDLRMGEEVCACVVKRHGAQVTAEELISHCQSSLAKYKTPRYVEFLDSLPKTRIGKIQKKEVRKIMIAKLSG